MLCQNCSNNISDESIFCPYCGTNLRPVKYTVKVTAEKKISVPCIVGFILSCCSALLMCCSAILMCYFVLVGFFTAAAGIAVSAAGVYSAKKRPQKGRGFGIAGIWVGIGVIVLEIIAIALAVGIMAVIFGLLIGLLECLRSSDSIFWS